MAKILEFKSRKVFNRLDIESALRDVVKKHTDKAEVIEPLIGSSLGFIDRAIAMIDFDPIEFQGLDEEAISGVQLLSEQRDTLAKDTSLLIQELIVQLADSEAKRLTGK